MEQIQKEIDLGKVIVVLRDNRKKIGITTGIATLLAIIYCVFATPIFTARMIINPPKLTDAGISASQALSGLAALGGGGGFMSQKTDADITIAILKTTAVKDMVIKQFNLQKLLGQQNIELTRRTLDGKVKFIPDMKSGFVEVDVDDKNPQLAADIDNYYSIALGQTISNIASGRTAIKNKFYISQIADAKNSLNSAEDAVKQFAESHGFVAGRQAAVVADLSTQLQAQLIVSQSQLQSMSLYAAPDNPDYIQLKAQIASYKLQLDRMNEKGMVNPIGIPTSLAPELASQYQNLTAEVAIRAEIYRIIVRQYEANRLDLLSNQSPVGIQVVDPAQVPFYKSKPKRLNIVLGWLLFGLIGSSVYFIIRNRKKIIVEIGNK